MKRFFGLLAAVLVALVGFTVPAQAAYAPLPLPNNSVGAGQLAPNSVGWVDWGSALRGEWNTMKSRLNAVELKQEVYGKSGEPISLGAQTINEVGGPWFGPDLTTTDDDRYTFLGKFTLPKGTWLLTTSVKFNRTIAGAAGTRPQVALRIGQDQTLAGDAKWGTSAGTVGGADISPAKGHDLFGSAVATVPLAEATEVWVMGFGANDNQSEAGSGQITAAVDIVPVRVG